MRLRSSSILYLPLVALLPACAASVQSAQAPTLQLAALTERAAALETQNRAQAEQISLLRGQLALAQADAREARLADAPREVVRIGGSATTSTNAAWIEHESPVEVSPNASAPAAEAEPPTPARVAAPAREEERPVLRLHGVGAMPLTGTSAVRESLPPGPSEPPSVASVVGIQAPGPMALPVPSMEPVVLGRATPADSQAARESYRVALGHVTGRRFEEAIAGLTTFVSRFPGHPYVDNALFWRATSFYAMRRYNEALADFQRVIAEFPSGTKTPDALLQIGMCYQRLGDTTRARTYFERVRREFPQSVAARLAAREDTT